MFIEHKSETVLGDASDEMIAGNVNAIVLVLHHLTAHTLGRDDQAWLRRHLMWRLACGHLFTDRPAVILDA